MGYEVAGYEVTGGRTVFIRGVLSENRRSIYGNQRKADQGDNRYR